MLTAGPDGHVTLDVEGRTLLARSFVPLEPGRVLWLEVRQTGPPPWLAPAEQKGWAQDLLRGLVEARQASPQLMPRLLALREMSVAQGGEALPELTRLITLLEALSLGSEPAPGRVALLLAWLESGSRGDGSAFPAPLAQEINALTTTLARKGKLPRAEAGEHLRGLERSARLLDILMAGNAGGDGRREEWFLYPCLFAGGGGWGEWFIELPDQGAPGSSPEDFSLSFFLAMSRLGEVTLQVTAGRQGVRGMFKAATEAARLHLEAGIPELSRALEALGFGPVVLSSVLAQGSQIQELRERLQARTASQMYSLLNVRV